MTTTTPASGASFAHTAALLAGHLGSHALPEPASLSLTTSHGHSTLTAQLRADTVPTVAAGLLAWANTLNTVTLETWRPPERDWVHLCVYGTLTGPAGAVTLKIFGAVGYDPHQFPDLQAHPHQGVPLSFDALRSWAAVSVPTTTTRTPPHPAQRAGR